MRLIAIDRTPSASSRSSAAWTDAASSGMRTVAAVVEPLVDGLPPAARDQRRRALEVEVVEPRQPQAADLEDVAEALGRDQAGRRAAPLEDRVRRDGRAVQDLAEPRGLDARPRRAARRRRR